MVDLKFDDKGLIPVIIQNATNNEVIMLGYMNKHSIEKTLQDRQIWFYSSVYDNIEIVDTGQSIWGLKSKGENFTFGF